MKMFPLVVVLLLSMEAFAKDVVITQKSKSFSETAITIAVGDSLVFKNGDDTAHNVFSPLEPLKFNLGIQKPGADATHKFETAGVAEIRCAIHPKMKLTVTVK